MNNPTKQQILSGNRFRPAEYSPKPVIVTKGRTVKDNTFLTACVLLGILLVFTVYKIATV